MQSTPPAAGRRAARRHPFARQALLLQRRLERLPPNVRALLWSMTAGLLFVILNSLMRALSLAQAEKLLEQSMSRVALLYLAVFAGVCAAPFHAYGFLLPCIGLKTMVDVGQPIQALYQRWSQTKARG